MNTPDIPCYSFSARHASRYLSQFYEQIIGESGIHAPQFTFLAVIKRSEPLTVIELAEKLAMDRTTVARGLGPLERDGYIEITSGKKDRRNRIIKLTTKGRTQLEIALKKWRQAQTEFESRFGVERAANLREELRAAANAVAN